MGELDQAKNAQEREWRIDDAARILQRSEEIHADKKLFDAARKELAKRQKTLTNLITKLGGK